MVGFPSAATRFGFTPLLFLGGGWRDDALRSWLAPLVSAFIERSFLSGTLNIVFLLIAGRFVEKVVRPVGIAVLFVAGAYAGALARLVLTPYSIMPSAGLDPSVFALIGAYFVLYGIPAAIPIAPGRSRAVKIVVLAGLWVLFQLAFSAAVQHFELSVTIIAPLGGLIAGCALARPLLAWTYRKA